MKLVNHPNMVKLLGATDTRETLLVVMEYLSGGDSSTYREAQGCLTEAGPEARSASWSRLCSTATRGAWCTGT